MSGRQGRSGRRPGLGPERCGRVTVTVRGTEWRPPARQAVAASIPPRRGTWTVRGASASSDRPAPAGTRGVDAEAFSTANRRGTQARFIGQCPLSTPLVVPSRHLSHPTAADSWRFHERPLCAWGLACAERATCAFTPPGLAHVPCLAPCAIRLARRSVLAMLQSKKLADIRSDCPPAATWRARLHAPPPKLKGPRCAAPYTHSDAKGRD